MFQEIKNEIIRVLSFDVGVKNVGVSYIEYNKTQNEVSLIHGKKCCFSNWQNKLDEYLEEIIKYFNITKPINLCIEKQYKGLQMIAIMYYIIGYFTAKGYKIIICKPCTYGLYIETRKDRKQYSIEYVKLLVSKSKDYKIPSRITKQYHDVCDSICIPMLKLFGNDIPLINKIILDKI